MAAAGALRGPLGVLLLLLLLAAGGATGAWLLLRPAATEDDIDAVERAFLDLRDALVQGDDEAFFRMHSRAAREAAVEEFPLIRSQYLASPPEEREAFHALYHVTASEFLGGSPRDLVVKMLPWKCGWRERREYYRRARVKDVRFETVEVPGKGPERRGVLLLDISDALAPGEAARIPENFLPTVVFVKDPEGWRRRVFFGN